MGQTLAQFLHFIWQELSTWTLVNAFGNAGLFGVTHEERVPIGQNEHQVRGA